jgi:arginyl-tRNA synthetase
VISRDLRRAIARAVAAAGFPPAQDPGLRPTGVPGQYAASVALTLSPSPRGTAETLAGSLAQLPWIATAEVTGPGYLTITVSPEALTAVADSITSAGPACVTSDALAGQTVPAAPVGDPLASPTWEKARAALAVRLTARLAAAAGATVAEFPSAERVHASPSVTTDRGSGVARAVAFAGRDAVLFTLARAIPGKPLDVDQEIIARHLPGNPAYAVRYAHARAASGLRWAVTSSTAVTPGTEAVPPCLPADPGELALLDALSWLPERVATAARRGRPDEFARYLEDLASVTVDVLSSASHPGTGGTGRGKEAAPGSGRLALAAAARTGLAAGLGLLEVSAPDRI